VALHDAEQAPRQTPVMSDAPVQTQGGLEPQPSLPVRRRHKFIYCPQEKRSSKVVHVQSASFDDALEGADRNGFVAVHRDNHLPSTNWKAFAHVSATSTTLAPAGIESGDGSNHSANASFALRMASSSLSPAEAQPGSSGKNADQRFVSWSCSTTNRSFIAGKIGAHRTADKAAVPLILKPSKPGHQALAHAVRP